MVPAVTRRLGSGNMAVRSVAGVRTVAGMRTARRLSGEVCETHDGGAEREANRDPQRAVHAVDECFSGGGCELVGLGTVLLARVDGGADVVRQQTAIDSGEVREP